MNTGTRFDELLPFYVNGTLDAADRAWVDAYVREHPTAASELAWARSLRQRLQEDVPAVSSEVGLDRAMRRIRGERPVAQRERRQEPSSLVDKLRAGLAALLPQPMLRPALVGALALVAVQGAVILHMAASRDADDSTQIRAIPPGAVADAGPYLKINFKGEARESEIRLLLVEVNGSLAAGPGQLGDYYVRVSAAKIDALRDKVRGSAIVDAVSVVDGLPERP
jgi:hypothetical protein